MWGVAVSMKRGVHNEMHQSLVWQLLRKVRETLAIRQASSKQ